MMSDRRAERALEFAAEIGQPEGDHHLRWVLDQMVRILTDCPVELKYAKDWRGEMYTYYGFGECDAYLEFVKQFEDNDDEWTEGIAP